MSIPIPSWRAAEVSLLAAIIAASCALPGYDVGETAGTATGSGSTGSGVIGSGGAGMSNASSSSGGGFGGNTATTASVGSAGGIGGGGNGGAGGSGMPVCPTMEPDKGAACDPSVNNQLCVYEFASGTCCKHKAKCVQTQNPNAGTWDTIAECPSPGCPTNCSMECPQGEVPVPGCPCDPAVSSKECYYDHCLSADGAVAVASCSGGTWKQQLGGKCCDPKAPQCEPGLTCTTVKASNGTTTSYCK